MSNRLARVFPQAWQRQAGWLWLLWPLSCLYGAVVALRRGLYRQGLLPSWRAPVPVLVIGNISVGGSGKTPLILTLVQQLQRQGVAVGVISRGYGGQGPFPLWVGPDTPVQQCGDEPRLIVDSTGVPMAVGGDRRAAIERLLQQAPQTRLILSDDGLQHWALQRDLEWVVVDVARGLGNGQLLPTGFLREPVSRLQQATVIAHGTGTLLADTPLRMGLRVLPLQPIQPGQTGAPPRPGQTVQAVAGIAHPQRFFATVQTLGYVPVGHAFADHHAYRPEELAGLAPLLTTGKDAVKLRPLGVSGWVVPVQAALSRACWQVLAQQLAAQGIEFQPDRVSAEAVWETG